MKALDPKSLPSPCWRDAGRSDRPLSVRDRFEVYIARSAWRSSAEGVIAPASPSAMPMLIDGRISYPSKATGHESCVWMWSASTSGAERCLDIVHKDGEFVATQAGNRYGTLGECAQPDPQLDQEVIAGRMPKLIVDGLEPIKIDKEDRDLAGRSLRGRQRAFQVFVKQGPVGQFGQGVMGCLEGKLLLQQALVRDIAANHHELVLARRNNPALESALARSTGHDQVDNLEGPRYERPLGCSDHDCGLFGHEQRVQRLANHVVCADVDDLALVNLQIELDSVAVEPNDEIGDRR